MCIKDTFKKCEGNYVSIELYEQLRKNFNIIFKMLKEEIQLTLNCYIQKESKSFRTNSTKPFAGVDVCLLIPNNIAPFNLYVTLDVIAQQGHLPSFKKVTLYKNKSKHNFMINRKHLTVVKDEKTSKCVNKERVILTGSLEQRQKQKCPYTVLGVAHVAWQPTSLA